MVINMNKYFLFFIFTILSLPDTAIASASGAAATVSSRNEDDCETKYARQCALIDQHLENPQGNIQAMNDYTVASLRENPDFIAAQAFLQGLDSFPLPENLQSLEGYSDLTYSQKVMLTCQVEMQSPPFISKTLPAHIRDIADLYSIMLSTNLHSEEAITALCEHEYPVVSVSGTNFRDFMDPFRSMRQKVEREVMRNDVFCSSQQDPRDIALPLVLTGEDSIFDFKTFFYALSKGVALWGLCKDDFPGHGGVFPSPLVAKSHDDGHYAEIVDRNIPYKIAEKKFSLLKEFAGRFLDTLSHDGIFTTAAEKKQAEYAAFVMIHEAQIKKFCVTVTSSLDPRSPFLKLFDSVQQRFGLEEYRSQYSSEFTKAFFSDLAAEIVKVKPDLEEAIFPDGPETYDLDRTIEEHVNLVNWLKGRLSPILESY
tara:strand:+ start:2655 stop:3932 length:1278 start_codon:yes stop_codon:yes gene_type:complete